MNGVESAPGGDLRPDATPPAASPATPAATPASAANHPAPANHPASSASASTSHNVPPLGVFPNCFEKPSSGPKLRVSLRIGP